MSRTARRAARRHEPPRGAAVGRRSRLLASACGSRLTGTQAALAQGAIGHSGTGSGTGSAPAPRRSAPTRRPRRRLDHHDGRRERPAEHDATRPSRRRVDARRPRRPRRRPRRAPRRARPAGRRLTPAARGSAGHAGTSTGAAARPGDRGRRAAAAPARAAPTATRRPAGRQRRRHRPRGHGHHHHGRQHRQHQRRGARPDPERRSRPPRPGPPTSTAPAASAAARSRCSPSTTATTRAPNYADAQQACSSDFAMVGNASGFDDGSAQAVGACGIPDMAAEVSTAAAGSTADIFGASPGNAHYWALGPANYLKSTYPNAIDQGRHDLPQRLGHPDPGGARGGGLPERRLPLRLQRRRPRRRTPTTPPTCRRMQSAGAQYVTEYSDASSAERLLQAMQQANYAPQVVDWFSEEYSPQFAQQTAPESNGDLVLMSATAAYEEASSNPGLQLMESWMNRVAARLPPGHLRHAGLVGRPGLRAGGQGGGPRPDPGRRDLQAAGHHQLDRRRRHAAGRTSGRRSRRSASST